MIAVIGRSDAGRSGDGSGVAGEPGPRHARDAVAVPCRRVRRRSVALLCAVLGASLLASAPALAASQRGHVFSFAFGEQGTGSSQFSHPSGAAVNSSTGDVYVADRENGRVEEFTPVLNGAGELVGEKYVAELAVPYPQTVAVDNCTSESKPCTKEHDPSVGDVYVVGTTKAKAKGEKPEDRLLYKFSAEGVATGSPVKFKSALEGVAVDSSGALLVYQAGGAIAQFNDAVANEAGPSVQSGTKGDTRPGFAVDSKDGFYAGSELEGTEKEIEKDQQLSAMVGELSQEYLFLHGTDLPIVAKLEGGTGTVAVPAMDYEPTTAAAVDAADNVYVTNVAAVAGEQVTTVAVFGPEPEGAKVEDRHGKLIQRFGAPGLREGAGIAVNSQNGAVYVTDAASNTVDVFDLEPPRRPTVDGISAESRQPNEGLANVTALSARVNPGGADTHAYFEYGAASCTAFPSACAKGPVGDLGEGFGDQVASVEVQDLQPGAYHYRVVAENAFGTVRSAEQTFTILGSLGGLPDGRAWEMVSPPNKDGAEPEALTREGGTIRASVDGRAITYVADGAMPAEAEPEGNRVPEPTQILSVRESGRWLSQDISTPNETGAGVGVGVLREYQFFSRNLALALVSPFPSTSGSLARPPLSPPLSPAEEGEQESTVYLRDNVPLEPEQSSEEAEERQNYKRAQKNGQNMKPQPNPGYLPLVTKVNEPGPSFGSEITARGIELSSATPDLSHVVFESKKPEAAPGLYEWGGRERESKLTLVSELEGNNVGAEAKLGGSVGHVVRHAISNDGSLVFWTKGTGSSAGAQLYVRDTETAKTLRLDTVQPGPQPEASEHDPVEAVFQTASADGKRVFFTDTQRLTGDSKAVADSPDLYVFELDLAGGHPSGTVTDLTAQESAGVLGGVLGASEDGSYVYFVANGALTADAARGHCPPSGAFRPPGTTCNLYVRHRNETTGQWEPAKLIAVLSNEDVPDWGSASQGKGLSYMTSRVSPSGRYLAFMSERRLTGYNNEDVNSKEPGERLDEEVYLYDASSERLTCASCNPSGARPRGVLDVGADDSGGTGEGIGLVVDRKELWATTRNTLAVDHWLAGSIPGWTALELFNRAIYQSRYLSDSGRLFFNSADALVPLAKSTKKQKVGGEELNVGLENVYEYEPGGVGSCASEGGCVGLISSGTSEHESAFLDASENGNDVFFLTAAKLAPQDVDTNFDVYDAHVCEGACPLPPSPPTPPCEGEEACQGSFSPQAPFTTPATASSTGSGNIVQQLQVLAKTEVGKPKPKPLTRAQKLAKALKACRKDKNKSKRLACEKQAKKKYGPIKPTAKKSSGKGKA